MMPAGCRHSCMLHNLWRSSSCSSFINEWPMLHTPTFQLLERCALHESISYANKQSYAGRQAQRNQMFLVFLDPKVDRTPKDCSPVSILVSCDCRSSAKCHLSLAHEVHSMMSSACILPVAWYEYQLPSYPSPGCRISSWYVQNKQVSFCLLYTSELPTIYSV